MPFEYFKVNNSLTTTLSEQIENEIKVQIANRTLLPGEQLPVMRLLSKNLGCGVVTINKALMNLKDQDILITKGNKGVFVADLTDSDISALNMDDLSDKIEEAILISRQRGMSKEDFINLVEILFTTLEED
ncbi:MAG: GntR family transcriptional regulator [Eubacteriales bacterium]|nr:GntR family transcriptional regulator [Eubacteriales bacterium]